MTAQKYKIIQKMPGDRLGRIGNTISLTTREALLLWDNVMPVSEDMAVLWKDMLKNSKKPSLVFKGGLKDPIQKVIKDRTKAILGDKKDLSLKELGSLNFMEQLTELAQEKADEHNTTPIGEIKTDAVKELEARAKKGKKKGKKQE